MTEALATSDAHETVNQVTSAVDRTALKTTNPAHMRPHWPD
jgi:hypothetical protein